MVRRVLILGIGNTLLTDDAAGVHAVRRIREEAESEGIECQEAEIGGFGLLDILDGFDAVVVIDAVRVPEASPGDVVCFDASSATRPSLHLVSGHQIDLPTALELGGVMGMHLPGQAVVVGIQVEDDRTFGERCTPLVEECIEQAALRALELARSLRDTGEPGIDDGDTAT